MDIHRSETNFNITLKMCPINFLGKLNATKAQGSIIHNVPTGKHALIKVTPNECIFVDKKGNVYNGTLFSSDVNIKGKRVNTWHLNRATNINHSNMKPGVRNKINLKTRTSKKNKLQNNVNTRRYTGDSDLRTVQDLLKPYLSQYSCKVCAETFDCAERLMKHRKQRHTSFTCRLCQEEFKNKRVLLVHYRKHIGSRPYKCKLCNKCYYSNSHLMTHMKNHENAPKHACTFCQKKFMTNQRLVIHVRRKHTFEKPFLCTVCKCAFPDKGLLSIHTRNHTGETVALCDTCGASFTANYKLVEHLKRSCCLIPDAQRKFRMRRRHILPKEGVRLMSGQCQCKICGATFKIPSVLIEHIRHHKGEKPYKCSHCEKQFYSNSEKIKHERSHKDDRSFACDSCKKRFSTSANLKKHKQVHTNGHFSCENCDKTFIQSSNLKVHMEVHAAQRLYECGQCDSLILRIRDDNQKTSGLGTFQCVHCDGRLKPVRSRLKIREFFAMLSPEQLQNLRHEETK